MLLSILIPSLPERESMLDSLCVNIMNQAEGYEVEIVVNKTDRHMTTGEKRNMLLAMANGKYTWFIDDDDEILPGSIAKICEALLKDPDCIPIDGYMTSNGENRVEWEMRIGHPYSATQRDGKEFYLRFPNHIAVIRKEIALRIPFEHVTFGEDYRWAKQINDLGLLKTQEIIDQHVYHYKYTK